MNDPTHAGPPDIAVTGGATEIHTPEEDFRPTGARRLVGRLAEYGADLTTPILLERANAQYHAATDAVLRAREDPEYVVGARDVMASLDEFLEKKAADDFSGKAPLARMPNRYEVGTQMVGYGVKGFAQGAGSAVAEALMAGIGKLMGGAARSISTDPKKRAILQRVVNSDPVLSDAVKRSPMMAQNIMEAYGTMNKFAPTLTTDVNAVRSFLREVVLGGGHVNYATIKNLVDTEKSLHQDRPWYHGV